MSMLESEKALHDWVWNNLLRQLFIFSNEDLRSPNISDILGLLDIGEMHGFLEMLYSINCMH